MAYSTGYSTVDCGHWEPQPTGPASSRPVWCLPGDEGTRIWPKLLVQSGEVPLALRVGTLQIVNTYLDGPRRETEILH